MKPFAGLDPQDLAPLGMRDVAQATVLPWCNGEEPGSLEMGVLDARGHVLYGTLLRRSYANGRLAQIGYPGLPVPAPETVCPGTAIYAGPWLDHFGHFLLESLARAWAVRRHPELPVVWSAEAEAEDDPADSNHDDDTNDDDTNDDDGDTDIADTADAGSKAPARTGWRAGLLDLLGIRNEMIFATRPLRFERLLVPEAGYRIQHFCHPEQAAALGVVERRPEPGRKLWLSRSRLPQLQNLSIPEVEARLEELGWTVIAPETLTIPEQMEHLARAERVAGEMGSQLHPLLFLKEAQGLRVDVFLRDPSRAPDLYNRNYDTIAAAKGLDQRMHRMTSEVVLRKHGVQVEKRSTDLDEYLRALDSTETPGEAAVAAEAETATGTATGTAAEAGDAANTERRHDSPVATDGMLDLTTETVIETATNTERRHAAAGDLSGDGVRPTPDAAPDAALDTAPAPAPETGMDAEPKAHTEEGHRMPNDLVTPDSTPPKGAAPGATGTEAAGTEAGAAEAPAPGTLATGPDGRPTLDALAQQFNTDKAARYRTRDGREIDGHAYADFYDRFFRDFRDEPITILELGCGQVWNIGASLRMLKAYFPQAAIIGVDNKPAARRLTADGFRIEIGDLGKIEFLRKLRRHRPTILIDDASHLWSHQILAMAELYDTIPPGGIYVMEDINTSFGRMRETYADGTTFSGHDFVNAVSTALHTFDDEHLKGLPYPEYIAYVARQTAFVAQFRHTALFVRR